MLSGYSSILLRDFIDLHVIVRAFADCLCDNGAQKNRLIETVLLSTHNIR